MNRRVTGLVAWCGLALVIAVPSAEVIWSGSDDAASVAEVEVVSPKVVTEKPSFDVAQAEPTDMPFQPLVESAGQQVASVPSPAGKALPLPTIVPAGAPRIVSKVAAVEHTPEPAVMQPALQEDAVAAEASPSIVLEQVVAPEQVALAPIPHPYKERPVYVTAAVTQQVVQPTRVEQEVFSQNANRSVVTLRATPRLHGDAIGADTPFWGDNPRLRNGQRLDSFRSVEILAEDDARDSGFFELWQANNRPAGFRSNGSFEEQLPARRGSSVRLDLLQ